MMATFGNDMASITYKEKTIELNRLTFEQQAEHLSWLRNKVMSEIKVQMRGLPLDLCKHIWSLGRAEAMLIDITSIAPCLEPDALAFALYLSAKQSDKDFSIGDANDVLEYDPQTVGRIVLKDILGFDR
jgi:hypothetical protein